MTNRHVKLAILRAYHDASVARISDQACIEMLMTNGNRRAVLNYWTDNTDGYVVLTLPGVLTLPNPKFGQPNEPATVTAPFDGGKTVVASKRTAVIPVMNSDHTFICHEVGHVLGFQHTYGVMNNGVEWDGKPPWDQAREYGDPYDIMSSASFGTRNLDTTLATYVARPTFAGPPIIGWPFSGAVKMGPAPARAHLHHWSPGAMSAASVRHLPTPAQGLVQSARLFPADASHASSRLVVIHPPSSSYG